MIATGRFTGCPTDHFGPEGMNPACLVSYNWTVLLRAAIRLLVRG